MILIQVKNPGHGEIADHLCIYGAEHVIALFNDSKQS